MSHRYVGKWNDQPMGLKAPLCDICGQAWYYHQPGELPLDPMKVGHDE